MTKRQTTQTQRVNLSKQGQKWLEEVDWDLLDQMDLEEEGQAVPMQDHQLKSQVSSQMPSEEVRVDPASGTLIRAMLKDLRK